LNYTNDQLTVSKQNLTSATSQIEDVDIANESTEFAKQNILNQSGTAMLAQANQLPQSVLKLLQ
jgi:flagellin